MMTDADECFSRAEIGRRIKVMMTHRNMTFSEIARVAGTDPNKSRLWATGESSPSVLSLFRLCRALNCSADYILGLREEKP